MTFEILKSSVDLKAVGVLAENLQNEFPTWGVTEQGSWVVLSFPSEGGPNAPDVCLVPLNDGRIFELCDVDFSLWADYDDFLDSMKGY